MRAFALWPLLASALCAAAGLLPAPQLRIVGAGNSSSAPAYGSVVDLAIECPQGNCPPWIRIDRTDGVTDTSPYVRVIDEGVTFLNAPTFPVMVAGTSAAADAGTFVKPEWGTLFPFHFGGSVDDRPIPLVCSGWSARYNGTRLTGNSSEATIYFDVGFERQQFELVVEDLGAGSVRLSVAVVNDTLGLQYDKVRFDRYAQVPGPATGVARSGGGNGSRGLAAPAFASSFFYHEESEAGSIVVTEQQPGIYYYGATPSYRGRAGQCTAGGLYTVAPSNQPTALVLAGPDGSLGNQSLPADFAGPVHRMRPLRVGHQFCIRNPNVTLFPGCRMSLPLCRPHPDQEIPDQPRFVSVVVPAGISVFPQSNRTSRYAAYLNRSSPVHESARGAGAKQLGAPPRMRYTFQPYSADALRRAGAGKLPRPRWSTYNNEVGLYFAFKLDGDGDGDARFNGTSERIEILVMIHNELADADAVARAGTGGWQSLHARLVALPAVALPSKLTTSITWADASTLYEGEGESEGGGGGGPYTFLGTYKRLGFNTVPLVSMNFFGGGVDNLPVDVQRMAYPGNRTGPQWQGLRFGPELSAIGPTHFSKIVQLPPNSSLLPAPLPRSTTVEAELAKWRAARNFHNATGHVDVAYDGIFFQQLAQQFCETVRLSAPDWIFLDDEAYGEGWPVWRAEVARSANAQARRLPGETDAQLAMRMVEEVFATWTGCLPAALAGTLSIGWYGTPWPDVALSRHGISMQPSTYGPIHYRASYPGWLGAHRDAQEPVVVAASGVRKPRQLVPWLTACTYGQMDARATLDGALHSYGRGATGFSFFIDSCFDDPGKMLALSTATAYATPFEDWLVDAELVRALAPRQNVLAWSGLQRVAAEPANGTAARTLWLVLTPADPAAPLQFELPVEEEAIVGAHARAYGHTYAVCDLTTGEGQDVNATGATLRITVDRYGAGSAYSSSYVLLISSAQQTAADCKATALVPSAWLPIDA